MEFSKVVTINVNRDGYTPEQCFKTMTVQELINILGDFPSDMKVYTKSDDGYTYGSIDVVEEEYC